MLKTLIYLVEWNFIITFVVGKIITKEKWAQFSRTAPKRSTSLTYKSLNVGEEGLEPTTSRL